MRLHPLESGQFTRIGPDIGYKEADEDGCIGGGYSAEYKNSTSVAWIDLTSASIIRVRDSEVRRDMGGGVKYSERGSAAIEESRTRFDRGETSRRWSES